MIRSRPSLFRCCALAAALVSSLVAQPAPAPAGNLDAVDPFLGTLGGGNVFPGPSLPFGFVQPGPDTGPGSSASGYKFNKNIEGFSQQRISGMGGPIMGQFSLFPLTGPLTAPSVIASTGKSAEFASPGYYTVTLAPWDVKVELTATRHVAFNRHTFPAHAESRILVDVGHCLYGKLPKPSSWSTALPIGGEVVINPAAREVSGFMTYKGGRSTREPWKAYFVARFDTAVATHGTWTDGDVLADGSTDATGNEIGAYLTFATNAGQVVQSKIGVSWRGLDEARAHLNGELPGWDFASVRAAARAEWDNALKTITVEGGTAGQRTQFATALYRVHLSPNDWTGESPLRYGDRTYYENILCLWDTFRTVNPLLTLIQPKIQTDIINTLLAYHELDGWTGDAHSAHQYEHVQNGSHADVVIADGFVKNLPGVDWAKAYAAIRKNAFVDDNPALNSRPLRGRFRLDDYRRHHFLPSDVTTTKDVAFPYDDVQAVSRTLEYVHNDFSVLTLARKFGTPADVAELSDRQFWYKNLWDSSVSFMRGKMSDGSWHAPFDPTKEETGPQYYEGHAWTWSWYVPHDPQGLINLLGGDDPFVDKLSTACEKYYEAYNEPCMLQTYLFIHAGRPDRTQFFVRDALKHFSAARNGLPGNDDSATTSAWLIWNFLGLYPNAGQDYYYIGSPSFTRSTLRLPAGKTLVISAPAASPENKYIAAATLDGKPWDRAWLRHSDIIDGAVLELTMVPEPTTWGRTIRPPSVTPAP